MFGVGLAALALWAAPASAQEQSSACLLKGNLPAEPPGACAAAIDKAASATDKAKLLLHYAYSLNEQSKGVEALAILDRAVALAPDYAPARHERAYTLNDLGFCRRALEDSEAEIRLTPDNPDAFDERKFSHYCVGDFEGALADVARQIALGGESSVQIRARAKYEMWLGRYDAAEADLARAQSLTLDDAEARRDIDAARAHMAKIRDGGPGGPKPERCVLKDMDQKTAPRSLIADCTAAFLKASSPAQKAEFLTTRSAAWLVLARDKDQSYLDLRIAASIDPTNANPHINYGYSLMGMRHSWAARNEFNLALEIDKRSWMALAGRAQANYNLGDKSASFADAKASFAIQPNLPATALLGDLAMDEGNKDLAKDLWLAAYKMGGRDEALMTSLKSVGIDDPAKASIPKSKAQ